VFLVAALRRAAAEICAWATGEARSACGAVVVVEQDRRERLAHVPFEVIGEQA
jgi:hypothetical protein